MVAATRQTIHQQKRHGQHQKHTKQFKMVYWPYLPSVIFLAIGLIFNFYWQSRTHGATLPYATSMSINQLLDSSNSDRAKNGVGSLKLSSKLNQAAQAKANDMVKRDYWSHNTPDGKEPWIFINSSGYKYQKAGENLAYGFLTSTDAVSGWMNSPPHRENLLDSAYQDVGFGFANSNNFNGDGQETVVVAMYGKPLVLSATTTKTSTKPASPSPKNSSPTKSTASKTPTNTTAKSKAASDSKQPSKEVPVTTAQAITSEPAAQSVSRIAAITSGTAPWVASTISLAAVAALFALALKHGLAIRKFMMRGERFVLHHMAFDAAVVTFIAMVVMLTRSAGIIR